MKNSLLGIIFVLVLCSCAKAPTPDPEVESKLADVLEACYNAQTVNNGNDEKLIDPKDILLGKAIDALSKAVDKGADPCAGVITNNTLQKVAMEENTKQIVAAADFGKSAAGNIVVGVLGWKGLDILPDLFDSTGSSYSLSSAGDMAVNDSLKSASVGALSEGSSFGSLLSNPIDNTATPYVFTVPQ